MPAATKVKMSGSKKTKKANRNAYVQLGSILKFPFVVVQNNGKEMHKEVYYTCKVVFWLIKAIFFCHSRCRCSLASITQCYLKAKSTDILKFKSIVC